MQQPVSGPWIFIIRFWERRFFSQQPFNSISKFLFFRQLFALAPDAFPTGNRKVRKVFERKVLQEQRSATAAVQLLNLIYPSVAAEAESVGLSL